MKIQEFLTTLYNALSALTKKAVATKAVEEQQLPFMPLLSVRRNATVVAKRKAMASIQKVATDV